MGAAAGEAAGGLIVTKTPKARPIAEINTELKIVIRSAMRICDEAQEARAMVRYLLEQALMALEENERSEASGLKQ